MFGAFLLGGVVLSVVLSRRRHRKDLRVYLEPDIKKAGMEFVSAVAPNGLLNCGPFPNFEFGSWKATGNFSAAGVQTSGDYDEYRIVSFRDSQGQIHRLWAMVEFESYHLSRVRWRAERIEGLPSSVLAILETKANADRAT